MRKTPPAPANGEAGNERSEGLRKNKGLERTWHDGKELTFLGPVRARDGGIQTAS